MRIQVTIAGVSPLLMNRFHERAEVALASGTTSVFSGDRGTPREQAQLKLYADTDGMLYVPGPNIFSAIVAAGSFHKMGRSKLTTLKSSLIPAGIAVEEIVCPLGTDQWEVDSRSVVIPSTGGRVMCYRPRLDVWALTFTLDVDTAMFTPNLVRALVDDVGKKIGLGDYRPSRKGPFGRFVVKRWDVVADDELAMAA
jgi:hypothetical protein